MSATANLEGLDDKALRAKCQEYGLPNIPITGSTRKILIKKLVSKIEGVPDKKAKTPRRETIHVTKIPAPENNLPDTKEDTSNKARGRRTITGTSANNNMTDEEFPAKSAPITQRRRSGRTTPISQVEHIVPITLKRNTTTIEEEDDEDDIILLDERNPYEIPERRKAIPKGRKSRSVSLSKGDVVTTSYVIDSSNVPPTIQETESESDTEQPIIKKSYDPTKPFMPSTYERETFRKSTSYSRASAEPKVVPSMSFSRSSADPKVLSSLSFSRSSAEPKILSYRPSVPEYGTPRGSSYSYDTSTSSVPTRRYTTHQPIIQPSTSNRISANYIEYSDDPQGEEDGEEIEAPYYSDFAKKLERLKAEQFNVGLPRDISQKRDTARYSSVISGRKTYGNKDSVGETFRQFLVALDRKYNLKRKLFVLCLILLFIYICIWFFY